MLQLDFDDRYSAIQVLEDPWIKVCIVIMFRLKYISFVFRVAVRSVVNMNNWLHLPSMLNYERMRR